SPRPSMSVPPSMTSEWVSDVTAEETSRRSIEKPGLSALVCGRSAPTSYRSRRNVSRSCRQGKWGTIAAPTCPRHRDGRFETEKFEGRSPHSRATIGDIRIPPPGKQAGVLERGTAVVRPRRPTLHCGTDKRCGEPCQSGSVH